MSFKPFDKNFTLTGHTLTEQLAALKAVLDKRDKAHQDAFADTIGPEEAEINERLAAIKRDKWHRSPEGETDA